jgi:hypothetical protein
MSVNLAVMTRCAVNSETVSERKRGRPRLPDKLQGAPYPVDARTTRQHQNQAFALQAWGVLMRNWEPAFAWLFSLEPCSYEDVERIVEEDAPHRIRWGVLRELGRLWWEASTSFLDIDGTALMLNAARAVCTAQPSTTREGEAFVHARRGES